MCEDKDKFCPKCLTKLEIEKELDYPYVCLNCDENFYNFEALENNYCNHFKSMQKQNINE